MVDLSYQSMARARSFLDHLPVSTADKERIAYGDAERLLRLLPVSQPNPW
jgi:predicted TIM-barrel fold metal-dependent hydrolase